MISMSIWVFIAWFVLTLASGIGIGWLLWGARDITGDKCKGCSCED